MSKTIRPNVRWVQHGAGVSTVSMADLRPWDAPGDGPVPFDSAVESYVDRMAVWGALLIVVLVVGVLIALDSLPAFWMGVLLGAFPSLVVVSLACLGAFLCGVPAPGGRR